MNCLLIALLIAASMGSAAANEDGPTLLKKAREARAIDDDKGALRHATAAMKQDPGDLEARWFILSTKLRALTNVGLAGRAVELAKLSPDFNDLADMAGKARQPAFRHFVTAMYARYYSNYDRATAEIDKAVQLQPKSARYVGAKGLLLTKHGAWIGDDKRIELGIEQLKISSQLPCTEPDLVDEPCDRDFFIAAAADDLSRPRWADAATHYERYLQKAKHKGMTYAYAWNNLSIAYRHLNQCQKAMDAAQAALKVVKFGAAEMNRNRAEFCLEMQKLGMTKKAIELPSKASSIAPGQSTNAHVRRYTLPDHGHFVVQVPELWTDQLRQPPNRLPPTIQFRPASGKPFEVLITTIWPANKDLQPPTPDMIRQQVEKIAASAKSQAIESALSIIEFQGQSNRGYYFSATDRAPKSGEFKFLTQGIVRVGELTVTFTVLTNDEQESIVKQAIELLKNATHDHSNL